MQAIPETARSSLNGRSDAIGNLGDATFVAMSPVRDPSTRTNTSAQRRDQTQRENRDHQGPRWFRHRLQAGQLPPDSILWVADRLKVDGDQGITEIAECERVNAVMDQRLSRTYQPPRKERYNRRKTKYWQANATGLVSMKPTTTVGNLIRRFSTVAGPISARFGP